MEIIILVFKVIMWVFVAGMFLCGAWVAYVYMTDLPSHSEWTEEEEKRMFESSKTSGIRSSEMGGNND